MFGEEVEDLDNDLALSAVCEMRGIAQAGSPAHMAVCDPHGNAPTLLAQAGSPAQLAPRTLGAHSRRHAVLLGTRMGRRI